MAFAQIKADNSKHKEQIVLPSFLSLQDFCDICFDRKSVLISPETWQEVEQSYQCMETCIADKRIVYGITTGFGPLANRIVSANDIEDLQRNLIYHLATGLGAPLSWEAARALMLDRLVSITRGWSGASVKLIELIIACLNKGLAPYIPEKGTVGASGDLTPCAHMALALMGEGYFITPDGTQLPARQTLENFELEPFSLDGRDGLTLVNGTSCMSGIAALNHSHALKALEWSLKLSVCHAELMRGHGEAWHPAFAEVRPHLGQSKITRKLNDLLSSSSLINSKRLADHFVEDLVSNDQHIAELDLPPQDPYTIRCVPQILGAIDDMLAFHERVVETEINASTDNPIFEQDRPFALHGGNFYGQHIAFASDSLKIAMIKLAALAERQIARITDEKLNKGLPAFLQPNGTGLHSGFMGAQVTATALLAELRTQAVPASIQSIPTNGNNQDVVSMGTIAARATRDVLEDVFRILAIQALVVAQGIDLLLSNKLEKSTSYKLTDFSETALFVREFVRSESAFVEHDRPLSDDIERVTECIMAK